MLYGGRAPIPSPWYFPNNRAVCKACSLRNDPLAHGVQDQISKTVEIQLGLKVLAMGLNGVETQGQQSRNLFVGFAPDQKMQNLFLTWSEQIVGVFNTTNYNLTHIILSE